MKFYSLLTGLVLLAACNNDNRKITVKDEESGATTTIDVNAIQKAAPALEEKTKELQALKPYTNEEMKAFLPETLAGASRKNMSVTNMMGTSYCSADYDINDTTTLSLKIFDCAGEAGAGIYSMQFLTAYNLTAHSIERETDDEVTRTVDFNGQHAVEQYEKDGSRSTLMWFAKDRLLVTLEGTNTKIEPIRQLAAAIRF